MSFPRSSASVVVLACFSALVGCSGSSPACQCLPADAAPADAAHAGDAGDAAATPEAAELPDDGPAVLRNDPSVRLVNVSGAAGAKLRLKSSNLTAPTSDFNATRWWYAEVINEGDVPACYVHVDVMAKDADGRKVVAFDTYASATAYADTLFDSTTSPCIPPGKSGYFNGAQFVDEGPSNPVASLEYAFDASTSSHVVLDEGAPTVTHELVAVSGGQELRGTLAAKADIRRITLRAFSFDENGLIVGSHVAYAPGDIAAGASWAFTVNLTPSHDVPSPRIVRVEPIVEYSRGLSPR